MSTFGGLILMLGVFALGSSGFKASENNVDGCVEYARDAYAQEHQHYNVPYTFAEMVESQLFYLDLCNSVGGPDNVGETVFID